MNTIEVRQQKEKSQLIEYLRKIPIVQVAVEKAGISRSTYYRWKKEDKTFARVADIALHEGQLLINDLSESQLISAIKDKNMTAIIFWLKHHHPIYKELSEPSHEKNALSDEEINQLSTLLYDPHTFTKGQELLTTYALQKRINEKVALFMLRLFTAQVRVTDVYARKTESDILAEVVLRKNK